MPKRIMPPARGPASRIVTAAGAREVVGGRQARTARRRRRARACRRAARSTSTVQPGLIASSPRKRSTELIPTASSSWPRLQAVSHGW